MGGEKTIGPRKVSISVYPGTGPSLEEHLAYVEAAGALGFSGVFSSLLLPVTMGLSPSEMRRVTEQSSAIARRARELGMWAATDVSDRVFAQYGASLENLRPFAEMGFTGIRIDAGFTPEQVGVLSRNREGLGLTVNSGVTSPADLERIVATGRRDRLTACFNFYPRPETGVSLAFVARRAEMYRRHYIPVSAFVPSQHSKRAPLHEGLPTVEDHRRLSAAHGARQLFAVEGIDEVILGDPLAPVAELQQLAEVARGTGVSLGVRLRPDLPDVERRLILAAHRVREDEADYVVRSDLTRALVKRERLTVTPRPAEERPPFSVTIDNLDYGRYMGELQICLRPLPPDSRVNVVGDVVESDRVLLQFLTGGKSFGLYVA